MLKLLLLFAFAQANQYIDPFTAVPHDFSATNVSSGSWVQVYQNTSLAAEKITCINTSTVRLYLGKSADSSSPGPATLTIWEVTTPQETKVHINANDDIFLKAVSTTASTGNFQCNFEKTPVVRTP